MAIHPKVAWSGIVGFGSTVLMYELQKHTGLAMDTMEIGFIAAGSSFITGYIARSDGEVPNDDMLTVKVPVSEAVRTMKHTLDSELDIPAKPVVAPPPVQVVVQQPPTPAPQPAPPAAESVPGSTPVVSIIAALFLVSTLVACSAVTRATGELLTPVVGASIATKITTGETYIDEAAKVACTKQGVFNTIAADAAFFGPQAAVTAQVASALVGANCVWANM